MDVPKKAGWYWMEHRYLWQGAEPVFFTPALVAEGFDGVIHGRFGFHQLFVGGGHKFGDELVPPKED